MALLAISTLHSGFVRMLPPAREVAQPHMSRLLGSLPGTGSTDTLVDEECTTLMKSVSAQTDASGAATTQPQHHRWADIMAHAPRVDFKAARRLVISYTLTCIAFAALSGFYAALLVTFPGWAVLQLFRCEPYTSHSRAVVVAGAIGGAILSVGFTTVAWSLWKLDEAYDAVHEAHERSQELPRPSTAEQRETTTTLSLAYRCSNLVIGGCIIFCPLTSGIVGPAVGTLILSKHGAMDSMFTAVHAMITGAIGTGVIVGIIIICLAVHYVTDCCDDD
ncbi:hypothetical protein DAEQUDRAFT_741997 [Daedalea quercina L-15889]|uniref:Transmembrane protein n=1 Tax=Daedalea quercina L-15889 TaxID=1314783 RepID=A0A165KLH3_9APHY|nr:hypothetical protein DAEQUDRAFT_741997 [Daedalea quercina L-15889]